MAKVLTFPTTEHRGTSFKTSRLCATGARENSMALPRARRPRQAAKGGAVGRDRATPATSAAGRARDHRGGAHRERNCA
jgi:hypothetical protein